MSFFNNNRSIDNTEYYNNLNVSKDATQNEIKKAYRKLAIKHHPDKGGDPEQFKKISVAYDVLSDTEKRKKYDTYGKDGLSNGGGHNPNDIFSMFFGNQMNRSQQQHVKKGKDVVHEINVSLEDLYKGKKVKINAKRQRIKYPANINKEYAIKSCDMCNGNGSIMQVRRMGPMIQQIQQQCQKCRGTGKTISEGVKLVKESKILEFDIPKGCKEGHQVKFEGESDEIPGLITGDIIFVIKEKKHNLFKRKSADLLLTKKISISDALCGTKFVIKHLDNRELLISTEVGKIIKPGEIMCVEDEGMPFEGNSFVKGKLFIIFEIEFPISGSLSEKNTKDLEKILPPKFEDPKDDGKIELCTLKDVNESMYGHSDGSNNTREEHMDQQHVQCAQQ